MRLFLLLIPMKKLMFLSLSITIMLNSCQNPEYPTETQLTTDLSYNHDLDNNDNFSPDDKWLVYDTRTEAGGIGACGKIEKVHVETGEIITLYELPQNQSFGPGVGAVSYSHTENKVVFIHGLLNITEDNPYQQWRRTGAIVEDANQGIPIFMDARDITSSYTPGALRGGTHRHEFSGDGNWIGFTYNDAVMKALEDATGEVHNLRTIGVSKNTSPVNVESEANGENISGTWFSALVVKVVPDPKPGSDEISRAAGDSWVGTNGYNKSGVRQIARAFIGTVKDDQRTDVDEVFIVDIPNDITVPADEPLQGTPTSMPGTPKGASQRRLTFSDKRKYPGCIGIVRSAPDGDKLAYVSYDEVGTKQIFTISPTGGTPTQQTFHESGVQSGARWHPDGERIIYICNNSIQASKIGSDHSQALTAPTDVPPADLVISHDGKTIAYNRLVADENGNQSKQIFIIPIN